MEYKVTTVNPNQLETELNSESKSGWILHTANLGVTGRWTLIFGKYADPVTHGTMMVKVPEPVEAKPRKSRKLVTSDGDELDLARTGSK